VELAAAVSRGVQALIRFSAELRFDALPGPIVQEAKNRLLDLVGCVLAGVTAPSSEMVHGALQAWGGSPEALVLGTGLRMPAALAGFCNGADGRTLTARVRTSKGDPSWPLTQEELDGKFAALARDVLPAGQIVAIQEAIAHVARCADIQELTALLKGR
jgi:2-methylcitrate dehydratase PrpD